MEEDLKNIHNLFKRYKVKEIEDDTVHIQESSKIDITVNVEEKEEIEWEDI